MNTSKSSKIKEESLPDTYMSTTQGIKINKSLSENPVVKKLKVKDS